MDELTAQEYKTIVRALRAQATFYLDAAKCVPARKQARAYVSASEIASRLRKLAKKVIALAEALGREEEQSDERNS